jgi:CubicO group peptidase (beta-lactamase class C family)
MLIALIGAHLWLGRILGFLVGMFLILTANELPRLRPNLVWGIRTHQTLENERIWRRVHRLAGYIRLAVGLVVCGASLVGVRGFAELIVLGVGVETIVAVGAARLFSRGKTAAVAAAVICCAAAVTSAEAQSFPLEKLEGLAAFVDTTIPKLMEQRHVAGTAVAIVQDGQVTLLRGYGKARLDSHVSVDPSGTLFRIGSLTKVFTAAAVVQSAEGGTLDLHRDVRDYLPDIPLRYGATTHQLLTHTAGLDEKFAGNSTDSPEHLRPLSEHLRRYLPEQVFRPGTASSYSNYNYAVAGLVLEKLSGLTYEEYLAERILRPLGMTTTTAHQPPPPAWVDDLARGYRWSGGRYVPIPYTYTYATPAGAMTTTAADMARFMAAMLGGGSLESNRILSPTSLRMMIEPQYTPHPRTPGWTYGFSPLLSRGRRLLYMGGTLGDQAAFMLLAPDNKFGVFVASNALPGIGDFLFEPMMTYLAGPPLSPQVPTPVPDARQRASRFTGTYRMYRQARSDMGRLRTLGPVGRARVVAEADGTIEWQGRRWMEVEPLLFRRVDSEDHILFRENASGKITGLGEYERVGWWEQTWVQLAVLASCVIGFLTYLLFGAIRFVRRRGVSSEGRTARLCALCVAGVNVVFVGGLVVTVRDLGTVTPVPLSILGLLVLPLVSFALTAVLPAFAARAWWDEWWTGRERLGYSTFAILALTFMTFLNYWRLLGVRY